MRNFIKQFDDSYWLSREESILTYLHQRNANVPCVQFKDPIARQLALENIGHSLNKLFLISDWELEQSKQMLYLTLKATESLEQIFNLGVLHLDIALRNVGALNLNANQIYILDFSHSISKHNLLQKPLNLIPTKNLHHPDLIEALTIDWLQYCEHYGIKNPKLDLTFEVKNSDFINYWPQSLAVQNLVSCKRILCHGIGNLLQEITKIIPPQHILREFLSNISKDLQNINEESANSSLSNAIGSIRTELERIENWISEKTPIPKTPIKDILEVNHSSTNTLTVTVNTIDNTQSNLAVYKPILNLKTNFLNRKINSASFEFLAWLLILLNASWINLIIEVGHIHVSENSILLIIALSFISLLSFVFSLIVNPAKKIFFRTFSILIICSLEITLPLEYSKSIISHKWLWVPSSLIIFFILIYYLVSLKNNIKQSKNNNLI